MSIYQLRVWFCDSSCATAFSMHALRSSRCSKYKLRAEGTRRKFPRHVGRKSGRLMFRYDLHYKLIERSLPFWHAGREWNHLSPHFFMRDTRRTCTAIPDDACLTVLGKKYRTIQRSIRVSNRLVVRATLWTRVIRWKCSRTLRRLLWLGKGNTIRCNYPERVAVSFR